MGNKYKSYRNALNFLNLENLNERRKNLCLKFAQRSSKHQKLKEMFPLKAKQHKMNTRSQPKFKIQHANNERLKNSPIIYMQKLLNENDAQ